MSHFWSEEELERLLTERPLPPDLRKHLEQSPRGRRAGGIDAAGR